MWSVEDDRFTRLGLRARPGRGDSAPRNLQKALAFPGCFCYIVSGSKQEVIMTTPGTFTSGITRELNFELLIMRVACALPFIFHGSAILFGAFGGPGPKGFAAYMHAPAPVGYLVGLAQFAGGGDPARRAAPRRSRLRDDRHGGRDFSRPSAPRLRHRPGWNGIRADRIPSLRRTVIRWPRQIFSGQPASGPPSQAVSF
jgi:hypothetical protein